MLHLAAVLPQWDKSQVGSELARSNLPGFLRGVHQQSVQFSSCLSGLCTRVAADLHEGNAFLGLLVEDGDALLEALLVGFPGFQQLSLPGAVSLLQGSRHLQVLQAFESPRERLCIHGLQKHLNSIGWTAVVCDMSTSCQAVQACWCENSTRAAAAPSDFLNVQSGQVVNQINLHMPS